MRARGIRRPTRLVEGARTDFADIGAAVIGAGFTGTVRRQALRRLGGRAADGGRVSVPAR